MRRLTLTIVVAASVALLQGCSSVMTPTGFSMPSGGFIYTGVTYPSVIDNGPGTQVPHRVIKKVHGTSEQTCILGMVAFGDGGVASASKTALSEVQGGDDIIVRQVDTEVKSILMLFTQVTTHVRGDAIQYTQAGR
jgi:uncharacterized protein YceK